MSTTFGSLDEFGSAMARLYDQALKHDQQIAENAAQLAQVSQQMRATDARLDPLASMIASLSESVVRQAQEIESHERRLQRMEGQ